MFEKRCKVEDLKGFVVVGVDHTGKPIEIISFTHWLQLKKDGLI